MTLDVTSTFNPIQPLIPLSCSINMYLNMVYPLVVVVVLLLKEKLLGGHVGGKCNDGDSKAGSGTLESVSSGEVGLVSPGLSVVSIGDGFEGR